MDNEKEYDYEEAAELLGITTRTVAEWKASGFIRHVKKGKRGVRFTQEEIDRVNAGLPIEGES